MHLDRSTKERAKRCVSNELSLVIFFSLPPSSFLTLSRYTPPLFHHISHNSIRDTVTCGAANITDATTESTFTIDPIDRIVEAPNGASENFCFHLAHTSA